MRFATMTGVQPIDPIHPRSLQPDGTPAPQAGVVIAPGAEEGTVRVRWDLEMEGQDRETDEAESDLRAL